MRRLRAGSGGLAAMLLAAALGPGGVLAAGDEPRDPATDMPTGYSHETPVPTPVGPGLDQWAATELIGRELAHSEGLRLGGIIDILIAPEDRGAALAVIEVAQPAGETADLPLSGLEDSRVQPAD